MGNRDSRLSPDQKRRENPNLPKCALDEKGLQKCVFEFLNKIHRKDADVTTVISELKKFDADTLKNILHFRFNYIQSIHHNLLTAAVQYGNKDMVKELLKLGADIDVAHHENNNALGLAVLLKDEEMVNLLLREGADVNFVQFNEQKILQLADVGPIKEKLKDAQHNVTARIQTAKNLREQLRRLPSNPVVETRTSKIKVVLRQTIRSGRCSSSENYIVDGDYYDTGFFEDYKPVLAKIKLTTKAKTGMENELTMLTKVQESGCFVKVLHPHVLSREEIKLDPFDDFGSGPIYAMVLEKGVRDLKDQIGRAMVSSSFCVQNYILPMVEAMEALHDAKIGWLDIKPENFIFVTRGDFPKLVGIDLETAESFTTMRPDAKGNFKTPVDPQHVTWEYAPPEIANRNLCKLGQNIEKTQYPSVTAKEYDRWSLGMTILVVANQGKNPFLANYNPANVDIRELINSLNSENISTTLLNIFYTNLAADHSIFNTLKDILLVMDPAKRKYEGRLKDKFDSRSATVAVSQHNNGLQNINNKLTDIHQGVKQVQTDLAALGDKLTHMGVSMNLLHDTVTGSFRDLRSANKIRDKKSAEQHLALLDCFSELTESNLDVSNASTEDIKKFIELEKRAGMKYFEESLKIARKAQNKELCAILEDHEEKYLTECANWNKKTVENLKLNTAELRIMKEKFNEFSKEIVSTKKILENFTTMVKDMDLKLNENTKMTVSIASDLKVVDTTLKVMQKYLAAGGLNQENIKKCVSEALQDFSNVSKTAGNAELLSAITEALHTIKNETEESTIKNLLDILNQFGSDIEQHCNAASNRVLNRVDKLEVTIQENQALVLQKFDGLDLSFSTFNVSVENSLKAMSHHFEDLIGSALDKQILLINKLEMKFDAKEANSKTELFELFRDQVRGPLNDYFKNAKKESDSNKELLNSIARHQTATNAHIESLGNLISSNYNADELSVLKDKFTASFDSLSLSIDTIKTDLCAIRKVMNDFNEKETNLESALREISANSATAADSAKDVRRVLLLLDSLNASLTNVSYTMVTKDKIQLLIQNAVDDLKVNHQDISQDLYDSVAKALSSANQQSLLSVEKIAELVGSVKSTVEKNSEKLLQSNSTTADMIGSVQELMQSSFQTIFASINKFDETTAARQMELLQAFNLQNMESSAKNAKTKEDVINCIKNNVDSIVGYFNEYADQAKEYHATALADTIERQKEYLTIEFSTLKFANDSTLESFRSDAKESLKKLHDGVEGVTRGILELKATQKEFNLQLKEHFSEFSIADKEEQQKWLKVFESINEIKQTILDEADYSSAAKLSVIADDLHVKLSDMKVENQNLHSSLSTAIDALKKDSCHAATVSMNMLESVQSSVVTVLQNSKANMEMLSTVLKGEYTVPQLLIVVPKDPTTIVGTMKRWVVSVVNVYFVCPVSLQVGLPIRIEKPRDWILKMAPVIKWSMISLKIALAVYGIPLPISIPNFGEFGSSDFAKFITKTTNDVMEGVKELENNNFTSEVINGINEAVSQLGNIELPTAETVATLKSKDFQEKMKLLTASSYADVYKLLLKHEKAEEHREANWKPKTTGLKMVTSKKHGTTSWVLDHPDFIRQYYDYGDAALRWNRPTVGSPDFCY